MSSRALAKHGEIWGKANLWCHCSCEACEVHASSPAEELQPAAVAWIQDVIAAIVWLFRFAEV